MNSEEEGMRFYVTFIFVLDVVGSLTFCEGVWPLLRFFMLETEAKAFYATPKADRCKLAGYLRVQNKFLEVLEATWGQASIIRGKGGRITLKLKQSYLFNDSSYQIPAKTILLHSYSEILDCAMGISKICLRQSLLSDFPIMGYWHTGIGLRRVDGGIDLVEIRVDWISAKIEIRDCLQAVAHSTTNEFMIDNSLIGSRGNVHPDRILFRIAMIIGKLVCYQPPVIVCDHISNFVHTSDILWTTGVIDLPPGLPSFPFGSINREVLEEIEAKIKKIIDIETDQNQN